jgi:GT2 family glycosyltransferase
MRPNGSTPKTAEATQSWGRVTSMARWIARRKKAAPATPRVSVVMPVYNAETTLAECLTRLFQSTWEDFEVVLVDDGSTDQTRAIADNFPLRVVPTSGRVGPAAARNLGARVADGEVVFFIDSDVMVRADTLSRLMDRYGQGDVDGLIGVQAADMRHRDLVSQYKNLWMRWTYLRRTGNVPLFYTTAAAIRREVFLEAGGFDPSYGTPNVEDTAFGQKLARLGIRVQVQPDLEVEHVKRYSLFSLLRTDFMRAVSLTRLKLRHRGDLSRNDTSVPGGYVASIPLTVLAVLALVAGVVLRIPAVGGLGVLGLVGVGALNREFLGVIRRSEGWLRAMGAFPLLVTELFVAGVGSGVGLLTFPFGRRY